MPMAFDVRLLGGMTVFCAVAETGTFVGAGASLGLTQSGVSRSIQRLEEQLNTRLFFRSPRAVALTTDGRRFYDEVRPILARLEETADRTAGGATKARGHLRVNVDATIAQLVLGPNLGAFLAKHPALSVELCVRDEVGDLLADGFDLAIRFGEPARTHLAARKLAESRILTCASGEYLKRRGRPGQPRDLARQAHACLLFQDPVTRQPFPWEFHRGKRVLTVPVTGQLIFDDGPSQVAACIAGVGIAQLFAFALGDHLRSGALENLFPDWTDEMFPLCAYSPTSNYMPAKVRAMQEFIEQLVPDFRRTLGSAF